MPRSRTRCAMLSKLQAAQLLEMFDRVDDAPAQRAAVVGTGRKQGDLERAAVVALEHLHHQLAGRMVVEVGRQVADAQPPAVGARQRGAAAAAPCARTCSA